MEATGPLEDDRPDTAAALAGDLRPAAVIPGTDGPDDIEGTPEADEIDALGGDDIVRGLGGDDQIDGGAGDDLLLGGRGSDTIGGGIGNDTLDGGGGRDTLTGGAGSDELLGGGGGDSMSGGGGADTLDGGRGNDVMSGEGGADTLIGGPGNDELRGDAGSDTLDGGAGNDELRGGPGADVLDGKGAQDILIGGGGPDMFVFAADDGTADRVLDFVQGEDRLDISALLPGFQPGDDLDQFIQLEIVPQGTRMSIDPTGSGANFQLLAGLEGVEITEFTPEELGLATPLPAAPTVVSTNAAGELANGTAFAPSLSADGRYLSFSSIAGNLVGGDANDAFDVFRKDLSTGEVVRVTQVRVPGQGVQPSDADSFFSSISADGGVVTFDSDADNFSNRDSGGRDVFVSDIGSDIVRFVSIVGNQIATSPSISADGTQIAFNAVATGGAESGNPAPLDTITSRIFVRDLTDGSLLEASSDANGNFADAASSDPAISANGNWVAFESDATNLLGEDLNPGRDVYVKSLIDGSVRIATTTSTGDQGFGDSSDAAISGNGRVVAFQSQARFVTEDFDNANDIYLKNLQSGELTLVTINADGIKANGASFTPSISDDGRFVAFRSAADNLVAGDDNGRPDIFVADTQTGQFIRFELASDTSGALPELVEPTLSGDGSLVAFVDQITVAGNGSLTAGQVVVAPVSGFGAAALDLADVLAPDLEPLGGPAAATSLAAGGGAVDSGAGAAASVQGHQPSPAIAAASAPAAELGALVVQPDAA